MVYTTGRKDRILAFLKSNPDTEYTLEEICSAVTEDGKGRSTVYRLVSELVSGGCVKRISDGKTRHCTYQYVGLAQCHRHMHLKCNGCGKLIHLDERASRNLEKKIFDIGGFAIEEGTFLFGKCRECVGGRV